MKRERKVKTIGCKVTLEQFRMITGVATARLQSTAEWAREVLLRNLAAPEPELNAQLLFSELAAQRASMMMLMQHAINGTKITEADLVAILDDCDRARFAMGAARLRDAVNVLSPAAKNGAHGD